MVVTPFTQVMGAVFFSGVSQVVATDNIDDESDSLVVSCEQSSAMTPLPLPVVALAGYHERGMWPLGAFILQSVEITHLGERVTFTSAAFDASMKKKRDKSYQKLTLKALVAKIAGRHGLRPKCDYDIKLEHVDQKQESDAALLKRFAQKYNAIFNIKNGTLIFLHKKSPMLPIFFIFAGEAESYTFRHSNRGWFGKARIKYHDTKKNKKEEIKIGEMPPEYVFHEMAKNKGEAKALAQAKLERLQGKAHTASITLEGQNIIAGGHAICIGFGFRNDGLYLITRATHTMGSVFKSVVELERL